MAQSPGRPDTALGRVGSDDKLIFFSFLALRRWAPSKKFCQLNFFSMRYLIFYIFLCILFNNGTEPRTSGYSPAKGRK